MARPSKPLILPGAVVEAALRIIDTDGFDAFSMPRLARELNVQAPSLYYHFEDRAGILRAVARAIMLETQVPDPKSVPNWIEWFVALSLAFRQVILRHRNAAPVLMQFMPRDVLIRNYEYSSGYLQSIGLPIDQVVLVLDGMDRLVLGGSIAEALHDGRSESHLFGNASHQTEPELAAAVKANKRKAAAIYAEAIRAFLRGVAPEIAENAPAPQNWADLRSLRRPVTESTA
ncbi:MULTISPECIES: TetR/AcrR family transcriptional regulator [unclassified Mycolicibacterium]|uniref:TetR/AcrR family transcriptional regulator n=1 Tax=unclassified Mycolicibacterium TaxID=2636767 RepID=UPI0012DED3C3|nr:MULTISPECIES: TetR family transcriptional regulator [unclassified Mycolicibacterium]MUL82316.1 TetR family transcriptional regulator [Mycolicibacterium sp. CBMA 329]MUL88082.1 TetR family transcriptional regulator [Mycolicibacterium sp. CBMA 331]MUM02412.1 TetR family transcriptional regulator [Mycolicibacterium sp. CBMA 334]MUM24815.1 TetR family transcriptional regulator [Mycolicibacterium sp. CBMA 295]MUM38379.1 TetR family transcriptional regulator [Mycolicibacterium sp. CBMA 247]